MDVEEEEEEEEKDLQAEAMTLTVGKKPRVKTLSKLVLPHAPSPMMTSFLRSRHVNGAGGWVSTTEKEGPPEVRGRRAGLGGAVLLTCG